MRAANKRCVTIHQRYHAIGWTGLDSSEQTLSVTLESKPLRIQNHCKVDRKSIPYLYI